MVGGRAPGGGAVGGVRSASAPVAGTPERKPRRPFWPE